MSPLLLLGVVTLPSWIVYAVALVIVLLLVLAGVLYLRLGFAEADRYDAVAERDRLRVAMHAMQEMSRTHAETITRIAAVAGKKNKKGGR